MTAIRMMIMTMTMMTTTTTKLHYSYVQFNLSTEKSELNSSLHILKNFFGRIYINGNEQKITKNKISNNFNKDV
jgi:hypothetical protein